MLSRIASISAPIPRRGTTNVYVCQQVDSRGQSVLTNSGIATPGLCKIGVLQVFLVLWMV